VSARLRLTLSYAAFLVAAGAATLLGVYVVLRYVPNYPLTPANPRENPSIAASRADILHAVVTWSLAILGALAAIGMAGGWLLAGRILRPLQDIDAAARIAATGRLDHRIRLAGRNDEFRRLADTFDHMLDRLGDAFESHERFAANASHELRTPLAVTATMLEVARADPAGQDYPQLLERLQLTNARAIGITEALLRLADANAVTAAAQPVDLATIASGALAGAERRDVGIYARLDPAPATGDPALLGQLAANLIQNAVRHNVAGGQAWVRTGGDAGRARLSVENTGPQIAPETAARLAEPFLRGNGRTASEGHGLGLALVARIAAVHGGELAIAPRAGGGLVVTLTLS
jgi:two-component system sensor histidine kinase VanS